MENRRHLGGSFSLPENHFRHTHPQHAVMVNFRETKVFKGKMDSAFKADLGG
jgi:hypothetical protein